MLESLSSGAVPLGGVGRGAGASIAGGGFTLAARFKAAAAAASTVSSARRRGGGAGAAAPLPPAQLPPSVNLLYPGGQVSGDRRLLCCRGGCIRSEGPCRRGGAGERRMRRRGVRACSDRRRCRRPSQGRAARRSSCSRMRRRRRRRRRAGRAACLCLPSFTQHPKHYLPSPRPTQAPELSRDTDIGELIKHSLRSLTTLLPGGQADDDVGGAGDRDSSAAGGGSRWLDRFGMGNPLSGSAYAGAAVAAGGGDSRQQLGSFADVSGLTKGRLRRQRRCKPRQQRAETAWQAPGLAATVDGKSPYRQLHVFFAWIGMQVGSGGQIHSRCSDGHSPPPCPSRSPSAARRAARPPPPRALRRHRAYGRRRDGAPRDGPCCRPRPGRLSHHARRAYVRGLSLQILLLGPVHAGAGERVRGVAAGRRRGENRATLHLFPTPPPCAGATAASARPSTPPTSPLRKTPSRRASTS